MAGAIERGECDRVRFMIKPSLMEQLKRLPNVAGDGYPSHAFYDLSYNLRRKPFDDPAFRRALEHVIPKDVIRNVLLSGYAEIAASVIAPANRFWHNPSVKPAAQDLKKARDILAQAGYGWDGAGKLLHPA